MGEFSVHLTIYKTDQLFSNFVFPEAVYEYSSWCTSWLILDMVSLLNFRHSNKCEVIFYCDFNLHFPEYK